MPISSGCCAGEHHILQALSPVANIHTRAVIRCMLCLPQVALHIRRRVDKAGPPLHISRSCPAPSNAGAPVAAVAAADRSTAGPTPAKDAASAAAGDGSNGERPKPRQVYFPEARRAGVGGLNVLYFELVMLLVLSGALPAVYFRKRRYVRL
jgi:hypothetical protein